MKIFFSRLKDTQIIMLGFFITILIGAFLLMLPLSSASGQWTGFIDAFFTSTSAVCITGLAVLPTAEHWSTIGQCIILALIQIGGLGFMSIVTIIFVAVRKRITLRERSVIREALNINQHGGVVNFAKYIVKFTLVVEFIGAFILSIRFIPEFGLKSGIYKGIFHSISAFCNAGFDVIGNRSLMDYSNDFVINIVIMLLIIIGGLGFPVAQDMIEMFYHIFVKKYSFKFSFGRLKLQSKIALITTIILIVSGALAIFIFEYNNIKTLGSMNIYGKVISSFFQSVTLRTAGFCSIDQGAMNYSSKLISSVLMFVGGSPAGTAGGAKTVTMAILFFAVFSLIKGKDEINAYNRTIGFDMLQKALSVVIMMLTVIVISVVVLSITETSLLVANGGKFEILDVFYETVSAICTVGVTTDVTPLLSSAGKIVIIICMYIGRIGPITLAISLSGKGINKNSIHYPEGNVIVG